MARSFSITAEAFNGYVNWVLPALAGAMPAAQAILAQQYDAVVQVAAMLRDMLGVEPARLYRGVVLVPDAFARGILLPELERPFSAWSEDRDVASWFADPSSAANAPGAEAPPTLEGFLVEHQPEPSQILFHHAWAARFPLPGGRLGPLAQLAELHELVDVQRLAWALATQQVVITLALASPLVLLERPPTPATRTLDARLAWRRDRNA